MSHREGHEGKKFIHVYKGSSETTELPSAGSVTYLFFELCGCISLQYYQFSTLAQPAGGHHVLRNGSAHSTGCLCTLS